MSTPPDLVKSIKAALTGIASASARLNSYRDRDWTRQIKESLPDLAPDGCEVGAAGCANVAHGEWLFDLIWSRSDGDRFTRLPLVMESEWSTSRDAILWDFGKLVVAKGDLKLFIFQQRTDDELNAMISALRRAIVDFEVKVPGERYLLAGYSISSGQFTFDEVAV